MKKLTLILFFGLVILNACNESSDNNRKVEKPKGGRVYGGTFKISESEKFFSLYPISITDASTASFAIQIFEGLVKLSAKDLSIQPCLAEHWKIDTSGTIYTFHIKKGIKFHNDPCFPDGKGRELNAEDIKYSFEQMCSQATDNMIFQPMLKNKIVGATNYYEASANGKPAFDLEGVKVIDNYTVQIILEKPYSSFLYILTHPGLSIVAKEAIEQYGNRIKNGTGPFIFPSTQPDENKYILVRNNEYHGYDTLGNQLPFLDSIIVSFINSKKDELDEFYKGNLDVIHGLPPEAIRQIIEEHIAMFQSKTPQVILNRSPEMSTEYYLFNLARNVFKDKKVRQAFNYAIDRYAVTDEVLKGEATVGKYGITTNTFKNYDITKIEGYKYDPIKAKKLLAEAGYPDGKNFPSIKLELNSGGNKNTSVALAIQKQLKDNLNINIDIEVVPFLKKLEDEQYAKADMFRTSWIADYPSPESFLSLLYGKFVPNSMDMPSYPNSSRYQNAEFDQLYEKGMNAKTENESFEYFLQAEQLAINDAAVIVLWYNEHYILNHAKVKNLFTNPIVYSIYSEIYIQNTTEEITNK